MKNFLKVLGILAAIVGVVYVAAVYGEKIVAWARNTLKRFRGEKFYCYDEDFCADSVQADDGDFQV